MTSPTSASSAEPIPYAEGGTPEERLEKLEAKLYGELWVWRVLGISALVLAMMFFTFSLWALGRAGVF